MNRKLATLVFLSIALTAGCGIFGKRTEQVVAPRSALDDSLSAMSLKQLDEANLVMKVAFAKSLESWQGGADDIVAGCKISGRQAEAGISAIASFLDRAVEVEARKLNEKPKEYRLPIEEETCERDCSCGLGLRVLGAAGIDEQSHSKVKELKRLRSRLEAKAELITSERSEICSETATWVCTSDFMKALKP